MAEVQEDAVTSCVGGSMYFKPLLHLLTIIAGWHERLHAGWYWCACSHLTVFVVKLAFGDGLFIVSLT